MKDRFAFIGPEATGATWWIRGVLSGIGHLHSLAAGILPPMICTLVVAMYGLSNPAGKDEKPGQTSVEARPGRLGRKAIAAVLTIGMLSVVLSTSARAQSDDSTDGSTTEDTTDESDVPRRGTGDSNASPEGQVAYITEDGRVLLGIGEARPRQIGEGAVLTSSGHGAVAIAPTADLVAYVGTGGALVLVEIGGGGTPKYVATDVAVGAISDGAVLAWNATGDRLAYVAQGTEDMVQPSSSRPSALHDGASFPIPLPDAGIGTVVRVVDRSGTGITHIGDPEKRWMTGVHWSPADPIMLVESVVPGTDDPYTLAGGSDGSTEVTPTVLSADEPEFAPDGSFTVAVGPAKGRQELMRIAMDTLERTVLVVEDEVCAPTTSPDASRIVYATGDNCNRMMLISARGGQAFDVTPLAAPDTLNLRAGGISWTADGNFITYADCRDEAGETTCTGPTQFLEPDSGRLLDGPEANTISPIRRPLVQDVWVDVDLRGPLEFRNSFVVNPETQAKLTDTEANNGSLEAELTDGAASLGLKMTTDAESPFLTGTLTAKDPETGIDRTFFVLGRATLLGVRVFSITGVWYSTDDLPFATGEFNLAVRRR